MIIKILEKPGGEERVLIVRRSDGAFTFRKQLRSATEPAMASDDGDWSPQGPDCGIYDSADTEAMQRIAWLKAGFH